MLSTFVASGNAPKNYELSNANPYPFLISSLLIPKLLLNHVEVCEECSALLNYAYQRLDHCKFGENKPTCKKCPIHCYKPDMKEHMREAMRYAGPRMMWYHPIAAIKHLIREL